MPEYRREDLRTILDKDEHIFLDNVSVTVKSSPKLKAELKGTLVFPVKPPNYREGESEDYITLGELGDIIDQARYLLYSNVTLRMLNGSDNDLLPGSFTKRGTVAHVENPIPRNSKGVIIFLAHELYRPISGDHVVYYDLKIGEFIHEERVMTLGF